MSITSANRMAVSLAVALTMTGAVSVTAQVKVDAGLVEGARQAGSKVRAFTGIPFAAPPVGELRWKPPQPVAPWDGVKQATAFGNRCMQPRIFGDMVFRDEASEDCLYLNVWTPADDRSARLPVMVWIYGGGFQAGSASEPRQDGTRLAGKGVVVVSFNYRLGAFGFFAHPELTAESPHDASGNYGLMDQIAALEWVKRNIAAFGGDPGNVTIFGESAGSFAVSALMASPLAKGLFHKAIGESGAFFTAGQGTLATSTLEASEKAGQAFAAAVGADSLAALRATPAGEILKTVMSGNPFRFSPSIDGHVIPRTVHDIYADGQQAHVPLLAGWNADEVRSGVVLAKERPTAESFGKQTRNRFGEHAEKVLEAYPAGSDAEALESAAALASDMFIGYATWKWIEMHARTGQSPVFRYSFDRKIPVAPGTKVNGVAATAEDIGARHAGEIEYVFGTLDSLADVPWEPPDRQLSDLMMSYWTNFARSGDPNGPGLPKWPEYGGSKDHQVMHLDHASKASADATRRRYEVIDAFTASLRSQ